MIKNETNILDLLKNEHIIKFHRQIKTNNNLYLVYEYCNQGTLDDYLQQKQCLSETESLFIFTQLLYAFIQIDQLKVLHRDIKPGNIFINDQVVKLGDFGFCVLDNVYQA